MGWDRRGSDKEGGEAGRARNGELQESTDKHPAETLGVSIKRKKRAAKSPAGEDKTCKKKKASPRHK